MKPAALREIRRGHPWLFDGSIKSISQEGRPGDLAVVFDDERKFAAIGLYDPMSPIRVRILHRGDPVTIDGTWLASTVQSAVDRRQPLRDRSDTTAYRIIHGENDGLGGLVADLYDRHVVLKIYSDAWVSWLPALTEALQAALGEQIWSVSVRSGRNVDLTDDESTVLFGTLPLEPIVIVENGINIEVDLRRGHKTGYFLDQRHNRALVEAHSGGRSVLDVFASSGGFSVHAARGGAVDITAIDIAEPALTQAARTMTLNGFDAQRPFFTTLRGDAFDLLDKLVAGGSNFDLVIVDPPSMAARQDHVERALDAYRRLSSLAGRLVRPGGMLYLASCTARVSSADFRDTSFDGLRQAGVRATVVEETGPDIDHPVGFAEGRYLKGLLLTVD